jgi:hypothetical protein
MKILFLLGASSRIRNFDHTIVALAERGHDVRLAGRLRKGSFELPPSVHHARVSGRVNPTERTDEWRDFVDLLRGARDYIRYFDPRYAQATRLVRRAYEIAPTEFVLFCERHPWIKRHWQHVSRALAFFETLIPTDPAFEAFLREEQPDLVLVTPLVTFESYQTDYVKAAHRLGLPVAFIPFSWDNLTNKGLMRIHPDRVLVWNDVQRREAIELHGCAPDSVVVTGAARFDDFFAGTPSTTREAFFAQHGLDPSRPLALYLGSSQLTGPNEMELIRRWAETLRASEDEMVRGCNILVRPHPALSESWVSVDYSDLGHVAVSRHASRGADQDLFDSLHHAHVTVGLNTSAMLEAAIVGRPVHTLVIPGFDEGQIGTKHFWYLVEAFGGLATIARDLDEHRRQLSEVLRQPQAPSVRSRAFAEQFLRPHGIDQPVAPVLATEVERAASVRRRPQPSTPLWHRPLRWALLASLRRKGPAAGVVEDTTVVGRQMSLRPVRTALEELQQGTAPVFVGPWVDSVTNELLYWIPFVRWASATYGFAPERLIVISRGSVSDWYGALARRYLDASTLFSAQELEHWSRRSVPQSEQNPKTAVMSPFDAETVERAARAFDVSDYQVLHPLAFFRVLMRLRKDRTLPEMAGVLRHMPLESADRTVALNLPGSFVAVSLAFTSALPDSPENRAFLADLLAQVAEAHEVVIVDEAAPSPGEWPMLAGVRTLAALVSDGMSALQVQAMTLAKARAFIGAYGDLAVLAAFCRAPVHAFHSEKLPADQPERLLDAAARGGWGPVTVQRAHRFKGIRLPERVYA